MKRWNRPPPTNEELIERAVYSALRRVAREIGDEVERAFRLAIQQRTLIVLPPSRAHKRLHLFHA